MAGFRCASGEWEFKTYTLTAASNISQGTAVALAAARTVSEYSGGQYGVLGFITHASQNSLPAGQVVVAIPRAGCTAWADVPTGLAASVLSLGESYGLYKPSGVCSVITTGYTSAASRVVSIVGPCISGNSTIEVAFLGNASQRYSASTVSIQ